MAHQHKKTIDESAWTGDNGIIQDDDEVEDYDYPEDEAK